MSPLNQRLENEAEDAACRGGTLQDAIMGYLYGRIGCTQCLHFKLVLM